jgi:hypothetical protein
LLHKKSKDLTGWIPERYQPYFFYATSLAKALLFGQTQLFQKRMVPFHSWTSCFRV